MAECFHWALYVCLTVVAGCGVLVAVFVSLNFAQNLPAANNTQTQ
jgi:hypothetical protein